MTVKLWLLSLSIIFLIYGGVQLRNDVSKKVEKLKLHQKIQSENAAKNDEEKVKVNKVKKPTGNLAVEEQEILRQLKIRDNMHLTMSQARVEPFCIKSFLTHGDPR